MFASIVPLQSIELLLPGAISDINLQVRAYVLLHVASFKA